MIVEWDERKAEANRKKHRVSFEEAVTALMDPHAVTFIDESVTEEDRLITIGHSVLQRVLLVIHVERRADVVRVISARRANARERKDYEEGI